MLQRLLGGNSFKRPVMINCSHSNLLTKLLTALFINLDNLEDNDILASGLIKTPKFPELTMDRSLYAEENYELDSRSSVENQINRPNAGGGFSSFSRESAKFSQTVSGTSSFSETHEENSSCDESLSPEWPVAKYEIRSQAVLTKLAMKQHSHHLNEKSNDQETSDSEMEMMKERFSKLLLGEDMSGSGKGVCTAIAISNAITNLYATVFGQCLKLEPLSCEKKSMWKREMDCLFSVCDYIVEFAPFCQSSPDGSTLEVMTSRPRADICINLPALQKLDALLLEILDSFCKTEFWYIDQGILSSDVGNSGSFRRVLRRQEEKWWLPIPCVPSCGLSEKSRKHIQNKRECASQIHKAAMAINSSVLAEMAVPETYLAALPKSGKASLGDQIHRYITTADKFSPDYLLDHLNLKSEHEALELADRVEAAICIWQRKICANGSRSSWVKDLMVEGDKMEMLGRAETLLLCLKQRYPGLPQTTLDTSKIQYNKDVGQAILESYSRVLESLAFNIVAWIQDVLYANRSEITLKLQQFQVQSSSMNCII